VQLRDACQWLGLREGDDPELCLRVPNFRRAAVFVASERHHVVWDEPTPNKVWQKFNLPTNWQGDLDREWLKATALKMERVRIR
jgi:hypothetical protein